MRFGFLDSHFEFKCWQIGRGLGPRICGVLCSQKIRKVSENTTAAYGDFLVPDFA